jgi:hypothetical protein
MHGATIKAFGEPKEALEVVNVQEPAAQPRRRRSLCRAGAPQIQTRRIAPEAPKLVNPPSDPAQKPQAKSVLQAVKACDPLPMPGQYSFLLS